MSHPYILGTARIRRSALWVFLLTAGLVLIGAAAARAQGNPLEQQEQQEQPANSLPVFYEGDGLILSIERFDQNAGTITGRIMMGDQVYPYTASFTAENAVQGNFAANGKQYAFNTVENADDSLTFKTGTSSYTLRMVAQPSRPLPGTTPRPPAANPLNRPGDSIRTNAALPGTVTLMPHVIHDPNVNNMRSHTLLVPEGWQVEGGLQWSPELYKDFQHLHLRVSGPDGAQYSHVPGGLFEWSDIHDYAIQQGAMQPSQKPQPGQNVGGLRFMPMPQTTGEYVADMLMPGHRPNAQNVQLIDATELTEVNNARQEMYRDVIANVERTNQQFQATGGGASFAMFGDLVRVTYTENGQQFLEEFYVLGSVMVHREVISGGALITAVTWNVEGTAALRTPVETARQNLPILNTIGFSLRNDPRWLGIILELQRRIMRNEMEALRKAAEIARQANDEIFAMHQQTIRNADESRDRSHTQFINYIRDMQQVRMPDGRIANVPNTHRHVYANGNGGVTLSNQAIPNAGQQNLTAVQPVR